MKPLPVFFFFLTFYWSEFCIKFIHQLISVIPISNINFILIGLSNIQPATANCSLNNIHQNSGNEVADTNNNVVFFSNSNSLIAPAVLHTLKKRYQAVKHATTPNKRIRWAICLIIPSLQMRNS